MCRNAHTYYFYLREIIKYMKNQKIKCPHCGREYLAAEIFMPNSLLGKPYDIIRDDTGKITNYLGKDMDLRETYICDSCETPFRVNANIKFYTVELDDINFNKEYHSSIKKNEIFLSEK